MKTLRLRHAVPSLVLAALLWLSLGGTAGAQDPAGATLELRLPSEATAGQEIAVRARLTDEAGAAVVGAEVVFQREVNFMNAGGELKLGRVVTDEQGVATLSFVPRSEGGMLIAARFGGNGQYGPASASETVWLQMGPSLYAEEAGVKVPGINVSLLAGILGGVWGVYFAVMVLVWLIAREGEGLTPTRGGVR